jgi:hypothetical protein
VAPNWYVLAWDSEAPMPISCVRYGVAFCAGGNACDGANRGFLCRQCEDGYTLSDHFDGRSECAPCADMGWDLVQLLLLVAVFLGYGVALYKAARHNSSSMSRVNSVVYKIIMNHLIMLLTTMRALSFETHSIRFWGDFLFRFVFDLVIPTEQFMKLDCVLPTFINKIHFCIALAWLVTPTFVIASISLQLIRGKEHFVGELEKRKEQDREKEEAREVQRGEKLVAEAAERGVPVEQLAAEREAERKQEAAKDANAERYLEKVLPNDIPTSPDN